MVPAGGIEPSYAALSRRRHPESFTGMDPSGRLELPCQHYRSCGSPSILAGNGSGDGSRTHSAALRAPYAAVNISPEEQSLKPHAEVESAYPIYKTGASPSMLAGPIWCGVRDSNPCPKIGDLRSWPPTGTQPMSRTQHKNGARGENRTLLASLEGWNSTNE